MKQRTHRLTLALGLAGLVIIGLPHVVAAQRLSTIPRQARGTVAGWVTFGNAPITEATVRLTCANGCGGAQQTVVNAASVGCTTYAALAGPKALTGGCFAFPNIPQGQRIVARVRWEDGKQATLTSDGYFLPITNLDWIGVATYPSTGQNALVPNAPSDLRVDQAPANSTDPTALVATWTAGGAPPKGYRLYYCASPVPCSPQDSGQGGVFDIEGRTTTWTTYPGTLHASTVYCFAVEAYNAYGSSALSNEACRQTRPKTSSSAPSSPVHVAFTQNDNVYLMNADGSGRIAVTTDGSTPSQTNPTYISYPWYQWSPDGKYLLVVRERGTAWDLLLLDDSGRLLRTLVAGAPDASMYFPPAWADDGDQIAYIAAIQADYPHQVTVNRVGIDGAIGRLWTVSDVDSIAGMEGAGCIDPSQTLQWDEVGLLDVAPSLRWSIARHVAVYGTAGAGGLYVTDTRLGTTRALNRPSGASWAEAALSPSDRLAAVSGLGVSEAPRVVLTDTRGGATVTTVAAGELPAWSPDGRYLYFVQRTKGAMVRVSGGECGTEQAYVSAIWRANADGSHHVRLMAEDANALGSLRPTSDGRALIFSRVDNPRPGRAPTAAVQRLDLEGAGDGLTTLVRGAGRPVVAP